MFPTRGSVLFQFPDHQLGLWASRPNGRRCAVGHETAKKREFQQMYVYTFHILHHPYHLLIRWSPMSGLVEDLYSH